MTLRLRIWAWSLIVGAMVWAAIVLTMPAVSLKGGGPSLFSVPLLLMQVALALGLPLVLLAGSLILMRRRLSAMQNMPFSLPDTIFYSIAVVTGALPGVILLVSALYVAFS